MIATVSLVLALLAAGTPGSAGNSVENIFNGENAEKFEWPWVAWISFSNFTSAENEAGRCTGTLLSSRWVLTTAECFNMNAGGIAYPSPGNMPFVGLGDYDITSGGDREQLIMAEEVFLHPGNSRWSNDLALVKLSEPAKLHKKSIETVPRLGTPSLRAKVELRNSECYSIGWGAERTLEGGWRYPAILQKIRVNLVRRRYCSEYFYGYNSYQHICTEAVKNNAARCFYGDKGAPLMCWVNNMWTQMGAFSTQQWFDGCMGGVGLDSDIGQYRRWIRRTMAMSP